MKLTPLGIEGAWLAESPIWKDDRGFFREWFKAEDIQRITGIDFSTQQANISKSQRGVIRGIHYSLAPRGQAKWITCVAGSIQDVIVDIRPESRTFGRWIEVELKGDSGKAVFISKGLGHGFLAMEDDTAVTYLVSTRFAPEDEFDINPFDVEIGINWKIDSASLKISEKDQVAPSLSARLADGKLP
jgi:dTDP-4-dehydrorhamnose 3,5-epimerase